MAKILINLTVVMAVLVGIAQRQMGAQDVKTKEERDKILQNCLIPDRPRPTIEGNPHRNAVLCGKAISLPRPSYPEEAKAQKISGTVTVEIVIDEKGNIEWAKAIEGNDLLKPAAVKAACLARYSPTEISGRPVKTHGALSYRFVQN